MTDWPSPGINTPAPVSRLDDKTQQRHLPLRDRPFAASSPSHRSDYESPQDERKGLGLLETEAEAEAGKEEGMTQTQSSSRRLDLGVGPIRAKTSDTSHSDSDVPAATTARIAFAALLQIHTPLLVLSSGKTVVVANYAFEDFLGLDIPIPIPDDNGISSATTFEGGEETKVTSRLLGKSLSQLGIWRVRRDGLQEQGSWEVLKSETRNYGSMLTELQEFLDGLAEERVRGTLTGTQGYVSNTKSHLNRPANQASVHDVVVNVQIKSARVMANDRQHDSRRESFNMNGWIEAQMAISVWAMGNQIFFTLNLNESPSSSSPIPDQTQKKDRAEHQGAPSTKSAPVFSPPPNSSGFLPRDDHSLIESTPSVALQQFELICDTIPQMVGLVGDFRAKNFS